MKVKEFKKWLQNKNDEDIVIFSEYSHNSEAYTKEVDVAPRLKRPRKTEFNHETCKFCETLEIKDQQRLYCNKTKDIISKYDTESCRNFEHKNKNIKYCLECEFCYASYPNGCKSIYKQ